MSKLFWALLKRPNGTPEMIGFPDHETREKFTTTAARQRVEVSAGAHPATREEAYQVALAALQGARFILRERRDV